jgi:hypothetical protein
MADKVMYKAKKAGKGTIRYTDLAELKKDHEEVAAV